MRAWLAASALVLLAVPATAPADMFQDGSNAAPGAYQNLSPNEVHVAAYMPQPFRGCTGTGSEDVGAAATAAINYAKASLAQSGKPAANIVFPAGGCQVLTTIDYTNMTGAPKVALDLSGTTLLGRTPGMPVIDATNTVQCVIQGGRIVGDGNSIPAAAIRMGRGSPAPGGQGGNCRVSEMFISGSFKVAACYVNASEQSLFTNVVCNSNYPTAAQLVADPSAQNAMGIAVDGYSKFWSEVPTVMPGATTPGTGSNVGLTLVSVTGAAVGVATSGRNPTGIWIGNTYGHRWIGGYATTGASGGPGGPAITLWSEAGGVNFGLKLDVHKEMYAGSWPAILFDGPQATPAWRQLEVEDESCCGTSSSAMFGTGASITRVGITNTTMKFPNPNNYSTMFSDPTKFGVSGMISLGDGAAYNLSNTSATALTGFTSGCVGILNNWTCSAGKLLTMANGFVGIGDDVATTAGDMLSMNSPVAGRIGATFQNRSTDVNANVELRMNTLSGNMVSFLLKGANNTSGHGVNSLRVNAVAGMWLAGNGIDGLSIDAAGLVILPNLPTSAGASGLYVCADTVGRIYKKASCP